MKKYLKEVIAFILLLVVFYILPLFRGNEQPIGSILFLLVLSSILSLIIGCISAEKIKYLYPVACAVFFIPTVFIYYNSSAFIYVLFILVGSAIGLLIGMFIRWIMKKQPSAD